MTTETRIAEALAEYAARLANGLDTEDQEWALRNLGYPI